MLGTAKVYEDHAYSFLISIAEKIELYTIMADQIPEENALSILKKMTFENPFLQALYILDEEGRVLSVEQNYVSKSRQTELYGTDFSSLPIIRESHVSPLPVWKNNFTSPLARDSSLAVASTYNKRTILAEISQKKLIEWMIETKEQHVGCRTLILDDSGALILDSDNPYASVLVNSSTIQISRTAADENAIFSKPVTIGGQHYFVDAVRSEMLGWTFFSMEPADMRNRSLRTILIDIGVLTGISLFVVFVLLLFFLRRISSEILSLIGNARAVTNGNRSVTWTKNGIAEFDELAGALQTMMEMVVIREKSLESLNEKLEIRVEERTSALQQRNNELAQTIEELRQTRNELTRSENLASLGRMVAGVAHELNTPLGNGLLVLNTISDSNEVLETMVNEGLTKQYLEKHIEDTHTGLQIALRNIERAADLVSSFKKVAVDQAGNQRRVFRLDEMLDNLFMTLQPTYKRSRHTIDTRFEENIEMDSFPGVLGQIIGNLVQNALLHAFKDNESGTITISAEADGKDVVIIVCDSGHGVPGKIRSKIFDPFFTTDHEGGGTGLGLLIAQNGAENVLGGSLILHSPNEKGGASFILRIPIIAPRIDFSND